MFWHRHPRLRRESFEKGIILELLLLRAFKQFYVVLFSSSMTLKDFSVCLEASRAQGTERERDGKVIYIPPPLTLRAGLDFGRFIQVIFLPNASRRCPRDPAPSTFSLFFLLLVRRFPSNGI